MGSSPHARGPLPCFIFFHPHGRIIPACAGSTVPFVKCFLGKRDHPRMRGVHVNYTTPPDRPIGSSPHARGPLVRTAVKAVIIRIIPACAGSTVCPSNGRRYSWDHPRMRGVHGDHHLDEPACKGSSPHARGPPGGLLSPVVVSRIIPACAGSTIPIDQAPTLVKDHPRMRGVHEGLPWVGTISSGSSPHARGPLLCGMDNIFRVRIIPACAGST